jgi:hypothetical protein
MTLTVPPPAHGDLRRGSELPVSAETSVEGGDGQWGLGRSTNQYARCSLIDAMRDKDPEVLA